MVTEKTARRREEAIIAGIRPSVEKIERGFDFLQEFMRYSHAAAQNWQQHVDEKMSVEREIHTRDQKTNEKIMQELYHSQDRYKAAQAELKNRFNRAVAHMMIRCEQCGALITPVQIICHNCGNISSAFPYEGDEVEMLKNNTVMELHILKEKLANEERIQATYPDAQGKIDAMQRISIIAQAYQGLSRTESRRSIFAKIREEADGFISRCQDKHIEVAVVGDVKAGKSTLINALLGERMASTDATPETSTLVKYRTTKDKNYVKVSFYNREEWKALWGTTLPVFRESFLSEKAGEIEDEYIGLETEYAEFGSADDLRQAIMRWTSKQSREHYFVKELEVGYQGELFPHDVVLVDTPGLKDPVKYRSDITKQYISDANWVIACIPGSSNSLSSTDAFEFLHIVLSKLRHDLERMVIVATGSDLEKRQDRETLREHFVKRLQGMSGVKTGVVSEHFIYASPLVHLLLQEWISGALSEDDDDFLEVLATAVPKFGFAGSILSLDASEKELLREKLGVETLKSMLDRKVFRSRRKQLLEMIEQDYEQTREKIYALGQENLIKESENLFDLSQKSSEYFERQEQLRSSIEENTENLQQIQELLDSMESEEG